MMLSSGAKVVRCIDGEYYSAFHGAVLYVPDEFVFPPSDWGPLCVFRDDQAAVVWAQDLAEVYRPTLFEAWSVSFVPSRRECVFAPYNVIPVALLVAGTCLAEAVRLDRRIGGYMSAPSGLPGR